MRLTTQIALPAMAPQWRLANLVVLSAFAFCLLGPLFTSTLLLNPMTQLVEERVPQEDPVREFNKLEGLFSEEFLAPFVADQLKVKLVDVHDLELLPYHGDVVEQPPEAIA